MKRILFTSTALSILFASSAFAQPRFRVPFEFQAAGKSMPSGTYRVSHASPGNPHILQLSNQQGESVLVSLPVPLDRMGEVNTKMVFRCADGSCELAEVWSTPGGAGAGRKTRNPQAGPVMVGGTD